MSREYGGRVVDAAPPVLDARELSSILSEEMAWRELPAALGGVPVVAVEVGPAASALVPPAALACIVVGFRTTSPSAPAPAWVDVALAPAGRHPDGLARWVEVPDLDGALAGLWARASGNPLAAVTLAQVLRVSTASGSDQGLLTESLAYSTLQAGPTHAAWLARRPIPRPPLDEPGPAVIVTREEHELDVVLNRPHVRNAIDARLRADLCEALAVAVADHTVNKVVLSGAGPDFCSGGDLSEFGTAPDPVTAHLVRTTRSPARLLHRLSHKVTARVHGACIGAGIELAAVAGTVEGAPDLRVRLPEIEMGLIPGAGGTVSIARRIGRQRATWLALSGEEIDAERARHWGLVDAIVSDDDPGAP
jgi:enoyl-CoA hydratase/carnithine racemase